MTEFNLDAARKVATLARLSLSEQELSLYAGQMQNILKFVEQLAEVDTSGIEPLANVTEIPLFLRDDVVNDGNQQQAVLANAPESMEGFFVVPKVVE